MTSSGPSDAGALTLHDLAAIAGGNFDSSQLDLPGARAIIRHKLGGEVSALLPRHGGLSPAQRLIQNAGHTSRLTMLRVATATGIASSILEQVGIRALAIKGAPLAWLTTGRWDRRASVDVDLLIAPRDVSRAHAALEEAGVVRRDGNPAAPSRIEQWCHCEMAYSGLQATIDLHWRMDACPRMCRIDFDDLWAESVPFEINNFTVRTPNARHALILSTIHGTRSEWAQWAMLLDVIRLARLVDIRSHSLTDLARASGVGRAFSAVTDVLSALPGPDPTGAPYCGRAVESFLGRSSGGFRVNLSPTAKIRRRWALAWSKGDPVAAMDSLCRALGRGALSIAKQARHED